MGGPGRSTVLSKSCLVCLVLKMSFINNATLLEPVPGTCARHCYTQYHITWNFQLASTSIKACVMNSFTMTLKIVLNMCKIKTKKINFHDQYSIKVKFLSNHFHLIWSSLHNSIIFPCIRLLWCLLTGVNSWLIALLTCDDIIKYCSILLCFILLCCISFCPILFFKSCPVLFFILSYNVLQFYIFILMLYAIFLYCVVLSYSVPILLFRSVLWEFILFRCYSSFERRQWR